MTNEYDYFEWLADGDCIRLTARAIIFNQNQDHILVESGIGTGSKFFNFLGGAIKVGESMQACIERELREETSARITQSRYLFVVENFFTFDGKIKHALEHFFEIVLDRVDVQLVQMGMQFTWMRTDQLSGVDLRPVIVRDCIMDGTYGSVDHLVQDDSHP